MNKQIFIALAIFFPSIVFCQSYVRAIDKTELDIYPWITYLSESDAEYLNEDQGLVQFFRVVITTSEIYNAIFIEKGTMGEEGGGKKILWRHELNEDDLHNQLDLKGEFAGVRFIKWSSTKSFKFEIQSRTFEVSQLDSELVQIIELNK